MDLLKSMYIYVFIYFRYKCTYKYMNTYNLTPTNSHFISLSLFTGYRVDDQVRDLVEAKLGDDDYNDVVLLNRIH